MTILFVCTGNTCRSPLAVAAWRALQNRGEIPNAWVASSAGIAPHLGAAASRHSAHIARDWGSDLSGHKARAADAESLRQADFCVGITEDHARILRQISRSMQPAPRVLCLEDFLPKSRGATQIADPFGGSREAYETCAALISGAVENLARHLCESNELN